LLKVSGSSRRGQIAIGCSQQQLDAALGARLPMRLVFRDSVGISIPDCYSPTPGPFLEHSISSAIAFLIFSQAFDGDPRHSYWVSRRRVTAQVTNTRVDVAALTSHSIANNLI
jgi:hypothetical protein